MRLFTFGCSFTKYYWPTWADILAQDFDKFENWGQIGAGNHFIFNSLIECNQRNNLTPTDTVVVMWSSIVREDRYCAGHWLTPGNIYSQSTYPSDFVKSFADNRGYFIRDLAFMQAAKIVLDKIGCRYKFLSMLPIENVTEYANTITVKKDHDCMLVYKNTIDCLEKSIFEVVYNKNWASRTRYLSKESFLSAAGTDWPSFDDFVGKKLNDVKDTIRKEIQLWLNLPGGGYDHHPIPILHAEYLNKLGFNLSNKAMDWANQVNDLLMNYKGLEKIWQPKLVKRL